MLFIILLPKALIYRQQLNQFFKKTIIKKNFC